MKRVKIPEPGTAEDSLMIGDRFRIVREIGHGAAGVVYEGVQLSVDRRVAIKVLHRDRQNRDDYEERFSREAKAIARLSHTNCITLYDFGYSDEFESLYMVMEFINGKELFEVTKDDILPLRTALRVGIQIAEALGHAHKHGILHRDLKPENVLVTKDWEVKVLDFGLARMLDLFSEGSGRRLTAQGAVFGTPAYMSPEQCAGDLDVTVQSDIYSLGIVLYELFEGRLPFDQKDVVKVLLQQAKEPPPPITQRIPERITSLIYQMLEKEPSKRPRTAQEVADTLRAVFVAVAVDDGRTLHPDVSQEIHRSLLSQAIQQDKRDSTGEAMRLGDLTRTTEDALEEHAIPPPIAGERLPTLELVGHRVAGRFTVGNVLSEGQLSTLFEATDEHGKEVALRIIGQKVPEPIRENLQREFAELGGLHHNNVSRVTELGHDPQQDRVFIVTERVHGDSISALLQHGRTSTELAVMVGKQIGSALAAAHERGHVHGHLQPSSILLSPRNHGTVLAKLTQLGLAPLADQTTTDAAKFRAPEQFSNHPVNESSDIYSLGVVLYSMLAGHVPWEGRSSQDIASSVLKSNAPALSDFVQEVPRPVSDLIQQMMSLAPQQRPRTAAEVADRFDRLMQQLAIKEVRVRHQGRSPNPMADWRLRRRVPIPVRGSAPSTRPNTQSNKAIEAPEPEKSSNAALIFFALLVLIVAVVAAAKFSGAF